MAGPPFPWRKLVVPSRFHFSRRISSSSPGFGAFDSPPVVHSRRVVVTGNSLSLSQTDTHKCRNPLKIRA